MIWRTEKKESTEIKEAIFKVKHIYLLYSTCFISSHVWLVYTERQLIKFPEINLKQNVYSS